ncbi:hypothetical protein P4K43_31765 [Bacillus cereus]|nr:hypothetical protein [Bacillus cereus]MEB9710333.1 hypothetical protein [Bacillus cereus]
MSETWECPNCETEYDEAPEGTYAYEDHGVCERCYGRYQEGEIDL